MTITAMERRTRAKRRYRARDLAESIIPLSTAIAVTLFFIDGGFKNFLDPASWPYGIGVVSGLIGTNLFLVMLILAARMPAIDRLFGHDRALELHKKLGKPVFYLIVLHMSALVVDYATRTGTDVISQAFSMMGTNTDMLMAFLAIGVMTIVIVTSLVEVRKRLSFGVWHAIHLLSYATVLLGVFHQFSWSGMFREGTFGRYYWLALYIAAVSSMAVFRFLIPFIRSVRHQLTVSNVTVEGPGVVSITMRGVGLDRAGFRSGHFAHWRFMTRGLWMEAHPFSLSAAPTNTELRVTVRNLGDATALLQRVRPGTRVWFEGPYGIFTETQRSGSRVALIGSGIGLAPIRALAETIDVRAGDLTVIGRAHTEEELFLMDEIVTLTHAKGGTAYALSGHRGVRTSWLPAGESERGVTIETIVPRPTEVDFYLCGPEAWMNSLIQDLTISGVAESHIHYEKFAW